jgi:hypothetical protein
MTRDEARAIWAQSGLTYDDLTEGSAKRLRKLIDTHLRDSKSFKGTFHAPRAATLRREGGKVVYADIRCSAYYFDNRQAVTFEKGGFVGFAGWADDTNVQPILEAFVSWIGEMVEGKRIAA